jgi:hypothetical protein
MVERHCQGRKFIGGVNLIGGGDHIVGRNILGGTFAHIAAE